MTKLPSSDKIIGILLKHGFYLKSQKGSHQKYSNGKHREIVPAQRKEMPVGTVKSISRQSGIEFENFINL
jgi:predicted RNA binding protein YcfA (HicA-like mRNA interferase family)